MTTPSFPSYAGYRFPAEVISHTVWLYFRFPLSLRMVDELLAARGIIVSHETVRQWARKFGQRFANQIRRRLPCRASRVMSTDKLASYGAAKGEVMPSVEHRRHKGFVWGHRCQGSRSAAAFLRVCWAERRLRANPRGVRHRARVIAPRACIRW